MSPLPHPKELSQTVPPPQNVSLHHNARRTNLNPFHYLTLPLKKNWSTVAPALDNYNQITRTIAILLGGLGLIVMLDQHKWKLPRWPWAKDGKNNPNPSFTHDNELYTVDELAEKKLMEMLKEVKAMEAGEEIIDGEELPSFDSDEDVVEKEAEEEFLEDAGVGVDDIVEEMEMNQDFLD
jgi:hypothetical protein